MQVVIFQLISLMLLPLHKSAAAAPDWETCLDRANFSYDADTTILAGSTYSASKHSCRVTLAVSGGKGEKWAVDLCDANIHIDQYPTLDAALPKHLYAGTAGCPAPSFGTDFDAKAKEISEYSEARTKIFEVFDKVKDAYGEGWEKVNLSDPNSFSVDKSAAHVACGEFLLKEYLKHCMSFEEKPPDPGNGGKKSDLIGVHDQTIHPPKN